MHRLIVDGACWGNPGITSAGLQILDPGGKEVLKASVFLGHGTNNTAEYHAVLEGLRRAQRLGITKLSVHSDSELVIKQLQGSYRVKAPGLAKLNSQIRELVDKFNKVKFLFVGRKNTTAAHNLAEGMLKTK